MNVESPPQNHSKSTTLRDLVDLVATLRAPNGCPWDREQTLSSVRAFLIEEAHETASAIDTQSWSAISEEVGDLLFQAAFIIRLGEELDTLTLDSVLQRIQDKMIERHPHVFGDASLEDADAVRKAWERQKIKRPSQGVLDGVPTSLPALVGAYRMSQKASAVGFDWPDSAAVLDKVREELEEVSEELKNPRSEDSLREEIGDLLFSVANLARAEGIDPEQALAQTNVKFRRRFGSVEADLRSRGSRVQDASIAKLEELWQTAKAQEEQPL